MNRVGNLSSVDVARPLDGTPFEGQHAELVPHPWRCYVLSALFFRFDRHRWPKIHQSLVDCLGTLWTVNPFQYQSLTAGGFVENVDDQTAGGTIAMDLVVGWEIIKSDPVNSVRIPVRMPTQPREQHRYRQENAIEKFLTSYEAVQPGSESCHHVTGIGRNHREEYP